ncbi:MAG: tetratricopeptide repeat protein [Bacteroidetes bacterium]|nr:tetratricopeptide repeat protein [Bacteroidota bacterium]
MDYSYKALKIFENNKDNLNTAFCYSQIGNLYRKQKSYDKAKDYFTKSYLVDSTNNIIENLGVDLTNLGLIYSDLKKYEKSVYYLEKSLTYKKQLGNKRGVVNSLNLLGATYIDWGKPNLAIEKLNEALELSKSINDNKGIANSLINLGASYQAIKDYKRAIVYLSECIEHSKKIGNYDILIDAYRVLSESYAATNNTDKAYQIHLLYTTLKDSIYNSESQKLMIDMQTKYDSEKKENENKLLQAENSLSTSTIKQQKITSYFIIGGLVLALLLAYFVFRGLKQQRKANLIISQQKLLVEEKHKEITDSINYAERIQKSFLASNELLNKNLKTTLFFFNLKML